MTVPAAGRPLSVFLVAGERSGDRLGAGLMRALRQRAPGVTFAGVGGDGMVGQGLEPLFPLSEIAVMGILPVLARLPRLLRRIDDTVRAVVAAVPDVLVIIDSPDFTLRVARKVRRLRPEILIVDYVSPTVWAWRPGRARAMRPHVDHLLALLPFEPAAHLRLGGPPCTYVGHPLVERLDVLHRAPGDAVADGPPVLVVLPGSRRAEIARLTGIFGDTVARVAARVGALDVVLPAVDDLRDEIEARTAAWPVRPRIVAGEAAKFAAFRSARAALAASGTVTLELALAGVPMVVGYRVSFFETWIRYVIQVSSIVLPNLILGENVIPEFVQELCAPERLEEALVPLLVGGRDRERQIEAFRSIERAIGLEPGETPSDRAAATVLAEVAKASARHAGSLSASQP